MERNIRLDVGEYQGGQSWSVKTTHRSHPRCSINHAVVLYSRSWLIYMMLENFCSSRTQH